MKAVLKANAISLLMTLVVAIYGFAHFHSLPEQMASHFDFQGHPDAYSSRLFVLLTLPLLCLMTILIIPVLVMSAPQNYRMVNSQYVIGRLNLSVATMLNGMQLGIVYCQLHPGQISFAAWMGCCFSIFMILIGIFFGKLERNYFLGIRLPWTLASEANWTATHRFAGKWMILSGAVGFALSLQTRSGLDALVLLLLSLVAPTAYSYRLHLQQGRNPGSKGSPLS